ncbi:MAG: D-alanyl-D-alanine carboxypeptidase/D-alanyl-D-alanine-endopeptidase [Pseudomonadota bacterium]
MNGNGTHFKRRQLLAGLLATAGTGALADGLATSPWPIARPVPSEPEGLGQSRIPAARPIPSAESLVAKANLGGKTSFVIADAKTGEVLEARNPVLPMPPASTMKSITALYALDALGGDFRFRTRLIAAGTVQDGVVNGDLILAGSGDPTLDTDAIALLADKLKSAGVTEVRGKLLTYDGGLPRVPRIDPGQPEHVGYNPTVSGLNLNFNRVHFEWRRDSSGYNLSMDARSESHRPPVKIARMAIADRARPVYTYRDAGDTDLWTVASAALGNGGSRWLPVRKPEAYCSEVFRTFARGHGITLVPGGPTTSLPDGIVLAEHSSSPLRELLRGMLKFSTNLTAETVGLAASIARGRKPETLRASGTMMESWLDDAMRLNRAIFADHSGLGDQSRVSASEMVRLLTRLGPSADLWPILKEVQMRNWQGQAEPASRMSVRAKTGTLNFVSALAGFARGPDGRDLVFSIFSADLARRATLTKEERDRPEGGASWVRRARQLQARLLTRWSLVHIT